MPPNVAGKLNVILMRLVDVYVTANCYIGHQKTSDLFLVSCQCEVAILKDLVTLLRLMGPAIGLNACVLHSRVTLNIQQGDVVDSCVCPCILSHICVNPYIYSPTPMCILYSV